MIVGFGGWLQFKFLFCGRNALGRDLARLCGQPAGRNSFRTTDDGNPGNVSAPVIVGFGGWLDFTFLFDGRNALGQDRIYAVNPAGAAAFPTGMMEIQGTCRLQRLSALAGGRIFTFSLQAETRRARTASTACFLSPPTNVPFANRVDRIVLADFVVVLSITHRRLFVLSERLPGDPVGRTVPAPEALTVII